MKKLKNIELKANAALLKSTKKGKTKMNKQEINKIKEPIVKAGDLKKQDMKEKNNNFVKKSKNIKKTENKLAVEEKTQGLECISLEETNNQKVKTDKQDISKDKNTPIVKNTKELKKIERKKAKKLAKKLKKQQIKSNNLEIITGGKRDKSIEQNLDGISGSQTTKQSDSNFDKNPRMFANEMKEQLTKRENGLKKKKQEQQKNKELGVLKGDINNKNDNVYVSGQTKESVICDKRSRKVDAGSNETVGAISNKILTKKEKKAEKRQMLKDLKLVENKMRDPSVEAATVFVGNLPVNTKRSQLISLFKKFGPVKYIRLRSAGGKVLFKHEQRKLAGSLNAYVVLQSKEKAEKALSLNGAEFKNKHLRITLATNSPKEERKEESKKTVFVGNLKYSASEEALHEIFSSCGEIEYVRCIRDGDKGCKGIAYVCFKNADAVGLALELNGTIIDERPIHVERYNIKKLGAKQAREAQEEKERKPKLGAKLRLEGKKDKKDNSKKLNQTELKESKKSKKSEFRGVKVNGFKKQKSKKKKSNDQMLKLAKKIAPKIEAD